MSSSVSVQAASSSWSGRRSMRTPQQTLHIYFNEAKFEFLKYLRIPAYTVPTILFPLMFYVIFGLSHNGATISQASVAAYLLATLGTFGVIAISLFGFGVGVATERGQGWMQVKRASPMPPLAYFVAKIGMSVLFALILITLMFTLGRVFGHIHMPWTTWLGLGGTLLIGVLPFASLGLAIAYFAGPNSAPAICNLIYLPMAFASGLWTPLEFLPKFVQHIAPFLPPYHLAQFALSRIGARSGMNDLLHLTALSGFTLIFLGVAAIGYRRNEDKMYG